MGHLTRESTFWRIVAGLKIRSST